jgi:hypothetical protein
VWPHWLRQVEVAGFGTADRAGRERRAGAAMGQWYPGLAGVLSTSFIEKLGKTRRGIAT